MSEQTFIILKPDAIKRGLIGKIISRFEGKGYRILRIEARWKTEKWCRRHYLHIHNITYKNLAAFMTSAPLIGIILEGPDAVRVIRNMVGATNSLEAVPGTIRGDFGHTPIHHNLIHAADNVDAVEHEKQLFYNTTTDYNPNKTIMDDKQQENHCFGS